jgi:hypothetical protein
MPVKEVNLSILVGWFRSLRGPTKRRHDMSQ